MRNPRSRSELPSLLAEQIGFLKVSIKAFDEGMEAEGKRIATVLRTLLKDSSRQSSLLKQTGHKQGAFIDTSQDRPIDNQLRMPKLVRLRIPLGSGQHARLVPNMYGNDESEARQVTFDVWWNAPVVEIPGGPTFSRGDLIQLLSENDGGAHVDAQLPESYSRWTREGEFRIPHGPIGQQVMLSNAHLASLRQMAHEMLLVLEPGYVADPPPKFEAIEISSVTIRPSGHSGQ